MICSICNSPAQDFASARVLGKHLVRYFRCNRCGFIRTEEPYWLEEAYSTAVITGSDVGLVNRNIGLAAIAKVVIAAFYSRTGLFVDYAGGYGLLVRLMRDSGFNFRWYDSYCENIFARGLEAPAPGSAPVVMLTAFEVFEHLQNPVEEMERMLAFSRNILLTTEILPTPAPLPSEWWYYGMEHGQHISFYTREALAHLAGRFGLNYYTNGSSVHLFTERRLVGPLFHALARRKVAQLLAPLLSNGSLIDTDYIAIVGKERRGPL